MSNAVLTAAVLVLAIFVSLQMVFLLALAQQVGRIRLRLGPIGARMTDAGPVVGSEAPSFLVNDQYGRAVQIGEKQERATLLMFVSPKCVICKRLIPGLRSLAHEERNRLQVVLVSDGDPEDHRNFLAEVQLGDLPYVISPQVGIAYEAGMTPYGVLIDPEGMVRSKGLCNHLEHVESLLAAWESGFATIQERLKAHGKLDVSASEAEAVTRVANSNGLSSSRG